MTKKKTAVVTESEDGETRESTPLNHEAELAPEPKAKGGAVKQQTLFLIGYSPRAGANWLMDTLAATGKAGVKSMDSATLYFGYGDDLKGLTKADIDAWFEAYADEQPVAGVKTNWVYLDHLASRIGAELLDYLLSKFTHHIFLERDDISAQAVSWHIAERSGVYHSLNQGNVSPMSIPYSQDEIASREAQIVAFNKRWYEWYRAHKANIYVITYEDMRKELLKVLKSIFQFLEITPAPTTLPTGTTISKLDNPRQGEYAERYRNRNS